MPICIPMIYYIPIYLAAFLRGCVQEVRQLLSRHARQPNQ